MFQNFPNFQIFQISKVQNFKKYSEIRGATSISDAFIFFNIHYFHLFQKNQQMNRWPKIHATVRFKQQIGVQQPQMPDDIKYTKQNTKVITIDCCAAVHFDLN